MVGKTQQIRPVLVAACMLALAALACGPVMTVVVVATPTPAVLTATPEASLPTTVAPPTAPPPGPTPTAGCTLGARWVADVTVPDNTAFAPGTPFVKTWRVRNAGTCPWEPGTKLVFVSGDPMSGSPAVDVPTLAPSAQTDVSVSLVAPAVPGTYRANYQFQAPNGTRYGPVIWVQIVVPGTPAARATPVCTPPPCPAGGILTCPTPGGCPGGCGVVCATPTVPPSGLAILSFTADVETLPSGSQRVTFRWRTQGATGAGIYEGTCRRFMAYWEARPPEEGSLTIEDYWAFCRNPEVTFRAWDAAGHSVAVSIIAPIPCRYSYFFPTDRQECPSAPRTTWAAEEPFERGFMIWLQEVPCGDRVQSEIIVFRNDGRYWAYRDTFVEGEPESDPTIVPPPGLYQPIRGFGKLWRTNPFVRETLGWATAPEQGFYTQHQEFFNYVLGGGKFFVRRLNGKVVMLNAWDVRTSGGQWEELP